MAEVANTLYGTVLFVSHRVTDMRGAVWDVSYCNPYVCGPSDRPWTFEIWEQYIRILKYIVDTPDKTVERYDKTNLAFTAE